MTTDLDTNAQVRAWVQEMAELVKPDEIRWCNGSNAERVALTEEAVRRGILIPLNPKKRPNSFLHRSNPNDVARVEEVTFICSRQERDAGPTNHWKEPKAAYGQLRDWFRGCMKGRTLYVVPYLMGPPNSPFSKVGIELTDSLYVVLNMRIMTHMGTVALEVLGDSGNFSRGLHSVGELDPAKRAICHFPEDNTVWSYGSGYGGNALLGKKCLALRLGSYLGRKEGWLAEHMLILGVESPDGQMTYVAAAFPSQCGKTNFAMMVPPKRLDGWKITTVGDDIAWLRVGTDGRIYGVNPEAGYFGVAPGTNWASNPNAMKSLEKDTLFTNVALTVDGDVWWEGMDGEVPETLTDWQGRPWKRGSKEKAAHPNSRFTAPCVNNPSLSRHADDPKGVPISAIIFGGRRATTIPLVMQSFNWCHGVYLGATMGSETTAAAAGKIGVVRRDPMAMLPFCGYHMGDYLQHWLDMQHHIPYPPKIFQVNWFRKGREGTFLWPGFGENMRVLKWVVERARGRVGGQETLLGWVPRAGDLELSGLDIAPEDVDSATDVNLDEWHSELESHQAFFKSLGDVAPRALLLQRELLLSRIEAPMT